MTNEKFYYLKDQAHKNKARFLLCGGVLYEVSSHYFSTGPSPLWSIDEVHPTNVPDFVPDPLYEDV